MYACLAVTCHLLFWQNDRDFLRATVVTRGWNGYRNKSQHRKSTPEKKILPPFQQGFEPATFQSRVRCSNHWAIPAPRTLLMMNWCLMSSDVMRHIRDKLWPMPKHGAINSFMMMMIFTSEARFNKIHIRKVYACLAVRKPEGSLGRTAQDVHLDSHTAPELCKLFYGSSYLYNYG